MIREKNFRALLGWLCASSVFAMYVGVPTIEFILSVEYTPHWSILFAFSSALLMDAAKPVKEENYRCLWLDGWLPMVGWICAFGFAWQVLIYPISIPLVECAGFERWANDLPMYSAAELIVLVILMLRATLHQGFGKSLSDMLNALLLKITKPDL